MFRKIRYFALALGAVGALALSAGALMPAAANASVNPNIVQTGPSDAGYDATPVSPCIPPLVTSSAATGGSCTDAMAGWYTDNFADLFTQVNGTFTLNAEAEGIGVSEVSGVNGYTGDTDINGAIGLQLCNESNGKADQLGAVYLGGGKFAVGYLTGLLTGLDNNPCVGGGVLGGAMASTTFKYLGLVPAGTTIEGQIRQDGPGVLFTAENATTGLANYTYYDPSGWVNPNEAGAGLQTDTSTLSAPAVNDLTDFTDVSAVDTSSGKAAGFDNWNAVEVVGSQDGQAPALITPTALIVNTGPSVCHTVRIKHRHKYHGHWRRYITRKVCTVGSDLSNNFSVDAGTPVGP